MSTCQVDPCGDLFLTVGPETSKRRFQVCSKTLSRASPVWKTMFYGPYLEAKPADEDHRDWVVALPDDDPDALAIIFNILHSNFECMPGYIDRYDLFKVTLMTNKYGITRILRPWVSQWMVDGECEEVYGDDEDTIWVFWELGHVAFFKNFSDYFISSLEANGEGRILRSSNKEPLYFSAPLDSIGILKSEEIQLVSYGE
ncbi:hypothetical protein GQ53DRAFT_761261 [Thozetella sp. PMI_491]|nr:hypothetical protein GQ53DRAFT_761261 [Thozetella sp. PMI_491]